MRDFIGISEDRGRSARPSTPGLSRVEGRGPGKALGAALCLLALGMLAPDALTPKAFAIDTSSWFGGSVTAQARATGMGGAYSNGYALPDGWTWASATTLSAGLGVKGDRTRAEASFDAAVLTGASATAALATAAQSSSGLYAAGTGENAASFRLRTLWAKFDIDWANLEVGRQVVNYGRGALWSPEDIFASLDLSGASPDRLGTDAIRLKIPLGALSGLDIVGAPATQPRDGRYATRISGEILGIDSGLLGAWDGANSRVNVAADCKFDLGPSFYAEALWSLDPSVADPVASSWARAVGGLDWSAGDFIFAAEYYWNGGGATKITSIDPSFPAEQYLLGSVVWSYSDFGKLSLSAILDPEHGPLRLTASFSLDASQNAALGATADLIHGDFAGMTGGGWTAALGAFLTVKF